MIISTMELICKDGHTEEECHFIDGANAMCQYLYDNILLKMREIFSDEAWAPCTVIHNIIVNKHLGSILFTVTNANYKIFINITLDEIFSFYDNSIVYKPHCKLNNAFQPFSIRILVQKNIYVTNKSIFTVYTPYWEELQYDYSNCYLRQCDVGWMSCCCNIISNNDTIPPCKCDDVKQWIPILDEIHSINDLSYVVKNDADAKYPFVSETDNYREIYKWYGYGSCFVLDETYTEKLLKNVTSFIDAKEIEKTLLTIRDKICVV